MVGVGVGVGVEVVVEVGVGVVVEVGVGVGVGVGVEVGVGVGVEVVVEVGVEVGELMMDLKGKPVVVFGSVYIYAGVLESADHEYVVLREPAIVYETGAFDGADWKDAQRLPMTLLRIERSAIESWGEVVREAARGKKRV